MLAAAVAALLTEFVTKSGYLNYRCSLKVVLIKLNVKAWCRSVQENDKAADKYLFSRKNSAWISAE